MNCFNQTEDFVRFLTEAHVVYRALEIAGIDDVDSETAQQFTSDDQKAQFVVDIAAQIVNEAWLLPAMSAVKAGWLCMAVHFRTPRNKVTAGEGIKHFDVVIVEH